MYHISLAFMHTEQRDDSQSVKVAEGLAKLPKPPCTIFILLSIVMYIRYFDVQTELIISLCIQMTTCKVC